MESAGSHIIVIGGLEPTGAAGVVRDHAVAHMLGARSELVVTALTDARAPRGSAGSATAAFESRPVPLVVAALHAALTQASSPRCAVKIGMTASADHVAAIAGALRDFTGPIVFDPVLGSSAGFSLFAAPPAGMLAALAPLFRLATVVTPNALEAREILGGASIVDVETAQHAAQALCAAGARAALVKGGHLHGDPIDVLCDGNAITHIAGARWQQPAPRGTGCALATALAFFLAGGASLPDASAQAKSWLSEQVAASGR